MNINKKPVGGGKFGNSKRWATGNYFTR